jgi:hypothetical protein
MCGVDLLGQLEEGVQCCRVTGLEGGLCYRGRAGGPETDQYGRMAAEKCAGRAEDGIESSVAAGVRFVRSWRESGGARNAARGATRRSVGAA